MQDDEYDLESMPGDEPLYVSGFEEADDDDSKNVKELLVADEVVANNVANKIDDSVPRMVANIFEERIHELLSDTLKSILPELLNGYVGCKASDVADLVLRENATFLCPDTQGYLGCECQIVDPVPTSANVSTKGEKEYLALVIHSSKEEPPAKKLKVVLEDYSIPSPTTLNSVKPSIIDNIPFEQFTTNLFSSRSFKFSPTPPPKVSNKGNGIA
nr:hypothetical protein [Tanacetum cinerariifolium]